VVKTTCRRGTAAASTVPRWAVVLNRYGLTSATAVVGALGRSSVGIYVFWDPRTTEILYIGLATDLALRFRQHNGLAPCPASCCRWQSVKRFLTENPSLGYTVLVRRARITPCAAVGKN
jgi:hypothetical protein